jgi:hypothetical protein
MPDDLKPRETPAKDKLVNILVKNELEVFYHPIKHIAFIDLLGFSALVKQFPGSLDIQVKGDYEEILTSTSKSSERFGRFHAILDRMAFAVGDASRPERMMIFSDCAFAVYANASQACVSMTKLMQSLLSIAIPVRMCLAKGTCHAERFSIESLPTFNLTRSMFYGSGVVFATEGEKHSGRGCRLFLHNSLDDEDMTAIREKFQTLSLDQPNPSQAELNYLHEPLTDPKANAADIRMWASIAQLRVELNAPIHPHVLEQYDRTFDVFNKMRVQFGRDRIPLMNAETIAAMREKLGLPTNPST